MTNQQSGLRASSTASPRKSVTSINLKRGCPAPMEHKEIASVRIALQRLLQSAERNRGGAHISVVDSAA
jgi:hypothetical protein